MHDVSHNNFCDIEQQLTDSSRDSILLPDGHHLTEEGHRLYAGILFEGIAKMLQ
jgi:lysophospholipase L1-like esterase